MLQIYLIHLSCIQYQNSLQIIQSQRSIKKILLMETQQHQKRISNNPDEPKSTVRAKFIEPFRNKLKEQKSTNQSASSKCLDFVSQKTDRSKSTKRQLSSIENLIAKNNPNTKNNYKFQDQRPHSHRILGSRQIDQNRASQKQIKNEQKKQITKGIGAKVQQKVQNNEKKIIQMRQQLQKIYQTFKQRQKQIRQMRTNLKNEQKVKNQNILLAKQIHRVQEMIKESLLEREKLKHISSNQLNITKKNKS